MRSAHAGAKQAVLWLVVLAGVAAFAASLGFDAVRYLHGNKSAWRMLALGWMGPLAGHFGWYANGLLLCAWILALAKRRQLAVIALALSLAALVLGLSSWVTLARDDAMFGRNEAENCGRWLGWGEAIYLWTASLCSGPAAAGLSLLWNQREGGASDAPMRSNRRRNRSL